MSRRPQSLRGQLLAFVVVPLALLFGLNVWIAYLTAAATANRVADQVLLAGARVIAEQTVVEQGVVEAVVPPAALEMFDTGHGDSVFYRVTTGDGRAEDRLLAGYPDFSVEWQDRRARDAVFRHRAVRAARLTHPVVGSPEASRITVQIGVTTGSRDAFARRLWLQTALQQGLVLLVLAILVSFWMKRGLAPLLRLRDAVMARGPSDLKPFDEAPLQHEFRPLVRSLNAYMARVEGQMAAQRRFVANAAHQLQTPLALLATQAEFALGEEDPAERDGAIVAIRRTTRQIHRLAAQLLMLARAEPGARRPRQDAVPLARVAREALEAAAGAALARGIDLALEEGGPPAVAVGDETMLREMIGNLVDNAIRYGRAGGQVTVEVAADEDQCRVSVMDNGPGIPDEERAQAFERFYRLPGTLAEGSGLGLAIVREIARAAGGSVELGTGPSGQGLTVQVRLRAAGTGRSKSRATRPAAAGATSPAGSRRW